MIRAQGFLLEEEQTFFFKQLRKPNLRYVSLFLSKSMDSIPETEKNSIRERKKNLMISVLLHYNLHCFWVCLFVISDFACIFCFFAVALCELDLKCNVN